MCQYMNCNVIVDKNELNENKVYNKFLILPHNI